MFLLYKPQKHKDMDYESQSQDGTKTKYEQIAIVIS